MQEHDGRQQFNITERLEDLRREHEALRWEGSFRDYFELVAQNPKIAQLSHGRVNDMVHAAGVERLNEGTQHEILSYNFFSNIRDECLGNFYRAVSLLVVLED